MNLKTLCYLDTETTGVDTAKDEIIEICLYKDESTFIHEFICPSIPISKEASDIHGMTNETLTGHVNFSHHAKLIQEFVKDCIIVGHNVRFDIQILNRQLIENGFKGIPVDTETIDTFILEKFLNSHKLDETYQRYYGKKPDVSHSAFHDVLTCKAIFDAQKKHDTLEYPKPIEFFLTSNIQKEMGYENKMYLDWAKCFYEKDNVIYFGFGSNKDKPAKDNYGYLKWMINQNFGVDTKAIVSHLLYNS